MSTPRIGIVSFADDLHALLVRTELVENRGIDCDVLEINTIAAGETLNCRFIDGVSECTLTNSEGKICDPASLDLIWMRRGNLPQRHAQDLNDREHIELTNIDSPTAMLGGLLSTFRGIWVNHPSAIHMANNKLFQLHCAQQAGIAIPATLVSQHPDSIRQFAEKRGGKVVIKPVKGAPSIANKTQVVDPSQAPDEVLNACPTMFQEYIEGTTHLRAHVFGDDVHAASIESAVVDWRFDLTVPFEPCDIPQTTQDQLREIVRRLGLKMGVCDLKRLPSGDHVFLECNQQGQFLFVEALTGLDLVSPFVDFLVGEAGHDGS